MTRLVYVSASEIPGRAANGFHVMKMTQAFVQEGLEVHLIVPDPGPEGGVDDSRLMRHYGVVELPEIHAVPRGVSGTNHEYYLRAASRARGLKADVFYTRCLGAAPLLAMGGRPTIYETHAPVQRLVEAIAFRLLAVAPRFRRLNVISHALLEMYRARYPWLAGRDVVVLPDAVDLDRFEGLPDPKEARDRIGLDPGTTAGYAGHLYPGRGIDLILALAERMPMIQFLIVGGRIEDVARFRGRAAANRLENVTFTGFVENTDLPLYLAACEVLLMPYQRTVAVESGGDTSRWMSPMKMFEYMAAGRLILSSDLPVLREVLNEENAVLLTPDDPDPWVRALGRAKSDVGWRRSRAVRAWRDAARYTWRARARRALPAALVGGRLDSSRAATRPVPESNPA